jgi:hypothetical protein
MSTIVSAEPETLMRQASMTAHTYLFAARESIDQCFGDGYAEEHPQLVAAFLETCARDFHTSMFVKILGELGYQVESALDHLAEEIQSNG